MCGIAGIIDFRGDTPDYCLLNQMGNVMSHRGPDDNGVFLTNGIGLTHRRLSIIDLSEAAHQPMANSKGTLWLIFNGEIYNYKELAGELKRSGHSFRSNSDSEVIIHAYEEWGTNCVSLFNGMFAFAIWDVSEHSLFAARDRLGIKPFYYWTNNRYFIFSSEIKSILLHPDISLEPNYQTIRRYLLHGNSDNDSTWYSGINQLMPGHIIELSNQKLSIRQYWDLSFNIDYRRSYDSYAEELRSLLLDSVRLHVRSDVPVGSHLSGGIDSSSIVAMAKEELGNLHTFSAAYPDCKVADERKYIDIVSHKFETIHHLITPVAADVEYLLPKLIWLLDEPDIGPSILPMYRVSEAASSLGVKVLLGGQGADECFAGYPPFFTLAAKNMLMFLGNNEINPPLTEYLRIPEYLIKGGSVRRYLYRLMRKKISAPWIRELGDSHSTFYSDSIPENIKTLKLLPLELHCYVELKHYLRGLLHLEDRMSMAWSVESRLPLLDYRIVEFSTRIPSWMKIRNGFTKAILRKATHGITPDQILRRKDKKGYPVPISKWFRHELKDYITRILSVNKLAASDLLDSDSVCTLLEQHFDGSKDNASILWRILNTELWFRMIIAK